MKVAIAVLYTVEMILIIVGRGVKQARKHGTFVFDFLVWLTMIVEFILYAIHGQGQEFVGFSSGRNSLYYRDQWVKKWKRGNAESYTYIHFLKLSHFEVCGHFHYPVPYLSVKKRWPKQKVGQNFSYSPKTTINNKGFEKFLVGRNFSQKQKFKSISVYVIFSYFLVRAMSLIRIFKHTRVWPQLSLLIKSFFKSVKGKWVSFWGVVF